MKNTNMNTHPLLFLANAIRVAYTPDEVLANRAPLTESQRKAIFAKSRGGGGGGSSPVYHSPTVGAWRPPVQNPYVPPAAPVPSRGGAGAGGFSSPGMPSSKTPAPRTTFPSWPGGPDPHRAFSGEKQQFNDPYGGYYTATRPIDRSVPSNVDNASTRALAEAAGRPFPGSPPPEPGYRVQPDDLYYWSPDKNKWEPRHMPRNSDGSIHETALLSGTNKQLSDDIIQRTQSLIASGHQFGRPAGTQVNPPGMPRIILNPMTGKYERATPDNPYYNTHQIHQLDDNVHYAPGGDQFVPSGQMIRNRKDQTMTASLQLISNSIRVAYTPDEVLANRSPLTESQRKAIFAKSGRNAGGNNQQRSGTGSAPSQSPTNHRAPARQPAPAPTRRAGDPTPNPSMTGPDWDDWRAKVREKMSIGGYYARDGYHAADGTFIPHPGTNQPGTPNPNGPFMPGIIDDTVGGSPGLAMPYVSPGANPAHGNIPASGRASDGQSRSAGNAAPNQNPSTPPFNHDPSMTYNYVPQYPGGQSNPANWNVINAPPLRTPAPAQARNGTADGLDMLRNPNQARTWEEVGDGTWDPRRYFPGMYPQ